VEVEGAPKFKLNFDELQKTSLPFKKMILRSKTRNVDLLVRRSEINKENPLESILKSICKKEFYEIKSVYT